MSACYLFWRHTTQVHVEPGLELVPIPAISNLVLMHDHEQSGLRNALIIFACHEPCNCLKCLRHCQIAEMLTPLLFRALLVGAAGFQPINTITLVDTAVKGTRKGFAGRVNWLQQSIKTPLCACFLMQFHAFIGFCCVLWSCFGYGFACMLLFTCFEMIRTRWFWS
jgi:hypothetical protein